MLSDCQWRVRHTYHVQHKAYKSVMRRQWQKHFVNQQDMLEVVDDRLAVQEIHGDPQEVPVERSGERQPFLLGRYLSNADDFFERDDLNGCDEEQHVHMPAKHAQEETTDHDKRPCCSNDKCLLLLLIFVLYAYFWLQYAVSVDPNPVHLYRASGF